MRERMYLCIDLKTFYASVECAERGLDPFKTALVVADETRKEGAICLAVTPYLKKLGVHNRCRVFEIPNNIKYIKAMPRMKKYIEYSANIYAIYLKYIAKEDIFPYSIDEMFLDVTDYLKMYKMDALSLAKLIIADVFHTTKITATCGIGTNLYLAKVALDIMAKKTPDNIGFLNEEIYQQELWHHQPLTDFWQFGPGITKRLAMMNIYDMEGICAAKDELLRKQFGINADYIIDHAKGIEPLTIADLKKYQPSSNSLSQGQVLVGEYDFEKGKLITKEMVDALSLQLVEKHLVTNLVFLLVVFRDNAKAVHQSQKLLVSTNVYSVLAKNMIEIYDHNVPRKCSIRSIHIGFGNLVDEAFEQMNLFSDEQEIAKERELEKTIINLKKKYGKNSMLRGMNLEEGSTARKRNQQIGGHNSGE